MFEKRLWKSEILSKDAGGPGFYICGTLVKNGFNIVVFTNHPIARTTTSN